MIKSEIKTITYDNGEIQRLHVVRAENFNELEFFSPAASDNAFDRVCELYKNFIIPKAPYIFSRLVLFKLPDNLECELPASFERFGDVADPLCAAAAVLRLGVKLSREGKPRFKTALAKQLYDELERKNCVTTACGMLPDTVILPVSNSLGMMSESEKNAAFKVNSSFFIMDRFDCGSVYDSIGTSIGLSVKNGEVLNPPAYRREALVCRGDGNCKIEMPDIRSLTIEINGTEYKDGENAKIFTRPGTVKTINSNVSDLVIIGRKVAAVKKGGAAVVPCSGFILRVGVNENIKPGDEVKYLGMEDVMFAIQVGNSSIVNGEKTEKFISKFYNIKTMGISYPPSLYPLDYKGARAPRIALGADTDGKPVIVWAEGAGKLKYTPGADSCGATLMEMADICLSLNMKNAVNLDGGGSAQILLNNVRSLLVSDRYSDNSESERAVPSGLLIR